MELKLKPISATRTRHGLIAPVLSAIFMGAGQFYNRQWLKGMLFALVQIGVIVTELSTKYITPLNQELGYNGRSLLEHSIWAVRTLGETPGVRGDHSLFLMINGYIVFVFYLFILLLYIGNIADARTGGRLRDMGVPLPNFKQNLFELFEKGFPYLLVAPGTIMLIFFTAMPLIFAISIAFTNYNAFNSPPAKLLDWVGFHNFLQLYHLKPWLNTLTSVLGWTVFWTIAATLSTFLLGLVLALLLNHPKLRLRRFFRTALILPWAIPGFISILVFRGLFHDQFGHINMLLTSIGFARIPWFNVAIYARIMVLLINLWLGFPWFMILCSGVIQSIPQDVYEAAEVDGASPMQRFWRITLPLVLYSVGPLLIMSFAFNFNNFNAVYLLTGGGPAMLGGRGAGSTDILVTWVFKLTFGELRRYEYASAISLIIFIFVAAVSIWNFRRTRQFQEEDMIQ